MITFYLAACTRCELLVPFRGEEARDMWADVHQHTQLEAQNNAKHEVTRDTYVLQGAS